jgi:transposase InsO family protein
MVKAEFSRNGGDEMAHKRQTPEEGTGGRRDELPDREPFSALREAQVLIEAWREESNRRRTHGALGY